MYLDPNQRIVVRHVPEAQARVAALNAHLHGLVQQQVLVEGTLAVVEDALLDAWRVDASGTLKQPDALGRLLAEASARGERATCVSVFRTSGRIGERTSASDLATTGYVRSYECASGARVAVPDIGCLRFGAVMEVRPVSWGDRILCDVRFTRQTGTQPVPTFETGVPGVGPVGLPETSFTAVGTTVAARNGEMRLAGRVPLPDPKAAAGAPARSLCFFVRPTLVPAKSVPLPDAGDLLRLRLVDVRAMTHRSGRLDTRELEGQEEATKQAAVATGSILESIKRDIAPGTWEADGVRLDLAKSFVVVRQTPAVVDQVVAWVDRQASRHFRGIAMRADLLMAGPGVLQALLRKHPGLDGGAAAMIDEESSLLMADADKRNGVSRLGSADLTGVCGQPLALKRMERFAFVKGYAAGDPAATSLPEVDVASDGFVLECSPELSDDGKTVNAGLRFYASRLGTPAPVVLDGSGRRTRNPERSEAKWNRGISSAVGAPVLVDGGLKATIDGEPRRLLLLVRFTPVP